MRLVLVSALIVLSSCRTTASGTRNSATETRSNDVNVVEVKNTNGHCVHDGPGSGSGTCSGNIVININGAGCTSPQALRYDCRAAISDAFDMPVMNAPVDTGYQSASEGITFQGGNYFGKEVRVAVKKSAYDAASFSGIGFYVNALSFSQNGTPPAPGQDNEGIFVEKTQLVRENGEVTLKSGEAAVVVRFHLSVPYSMGGSSSSQAVYFRPYARFVDGQSYQNWDPVEKDYFVAGLTTFNRSADVLQ